MARFPTRTRRLQEGHGEACGLYSDEPIDELTVKVILPANPQVQGTEFVNWYVGFGDPEAPGLHIEAGISFSLRRGWNAFFNPERRPDAIHNELPGPTIATGEREVDLTLIRRAGGGRVKFFVKMKSSPAIDLTPTVAITRANPSRVKMMSAASDVNLCSFDEVVMTVVKPDWYRPLPFNYRARGAKLAGSGQRLRVLSDNPTEPSSGFRTILPKL